MLMYQDPSISASKTARSKESTISFQRVRIKLTFIIEGRVIKMVRSSGQTASRWLNSRASKGIIREKRQGFHLQARRECRPARAFTWPSECLQPSDSSSKYKISKSNNIRPNQIMTIRKRMLNRKTSSAAASVAQLRLSEPDQASRMYEGVEMKRKPACQIIKEAIC